jgi:hypothetical protein
MMADDDRSREQHRGDDRSDARSDARDARYRAWNDDRLDDLAAQVRVVAALGTVVARHDAKLDQADDERVAMRRTLEQLEARMTSDIARVARECEEFHTEYRADRDSARSNSRGLVIAVIAGSFGILASIVSAAAVLIGGH